MAETLIVITMIAFLAVFMLGSLNKATPDKNRVMYKKAYSVIERAVAEMVNDDTLYAYDEDRIGFLNYDHVAIPGAKDLNSNAQIYTINYDDEKPDTAEAGSARINKFCNLFRSKLNTLPAGNDGQLSTQADYSDNQKVCKFYTTDGIRWDLNPDKTSNIGCIGRNNTFYHNDMITIEIDVNGREDEGGKNPDEHSLATANNWQTTPAGDVFCVDVYSDGRVTVQDYWEMEYLKSSSLK